MSMIIRFPITDPNSFLFESIVCTIMSAVIFPKEEALTEFSGFRRLLLYEAETNPLKKIHNNAIIFIFLFSMLGITIKLLLKSLKHILG